MNRFSESVASDVQVVTIISSVNEIMDIAVANGATLTLPSIVKLTLSDNTTPNTNVMWDSGMPAYNGNLEGTYVFSGTINLPIGVTNPNNVKSIVQVKVGANQPPTATNLSISGDLIVGQTLMGHYTYRDAENNEESGTTFRWYTADNASGTANKTLIGSSSSNSYTLTGQENGKYIVFEVEPRAAVGTTKGTTIEVISAQPIVTYDPHFWDTVSVISNVYGDVITIRAAAALDPLYVMKTSDFSVAVGNVTVAVNFVGYDTSDPSNHTIKLAISGQPVLRTSVISLSVLGKALKTSNELMNAAKSSIAVTNLKQLDQDNDNHIGIDEIIKFINAGIALDINNDGYVDNSDVLILLGQISSMVIPAVIKSNN